MPRIKDPFIAIRFNKSGQKVLGFQSGQASVSTSSSMRSVAGLTCGGRRWQHRQQRIRSPQQPGKDHLGVESRKWENLDNIHWKKGQLPCRSLNGRQKNSPSGGPIEADLNIWLEFDLTSTLTSTPWTSPQQKKKLIFFCAFYAAVTTCRRFSRSLVKDNEMFYTGTAHAIVLYMFVGEVHEGFQRQLLWKVDHVIRDETIIIE